MKQGYWTLMICFLSIYALKAQWCATPSNSSNSSSPQPFIQAKQLVEDIVIPVVFYIFDDNPDPKIQIGYSLKDLQYQLDWLNREFAQVQTHKPQQSIRFCIASADANLPLPVPQATDISYVEQVVIPNQKNALGMPKKMGIFYVDRDPTANLIFNDDYIQQMTGLDHQKYLIVVIAESAQHGSSASYATDIHGWKKYSSPYQHVVLLHQHLHTQKGILNDGDVLVHELGHYLGLAHIFESYCQGQGDQLQDTPPYANSNMSVNCTSSANDECGNYQGTYPKERSNHMDYKGDNCRQKFSPQQAESMVQTANHFLYPLISPQNLQAAEVLCDQDFSNFPREVVVATVYKRQAQSQNSVRFAQIFPNPSFSSVKLQLRDASWEDGLRIEVLDFYGRSLAVAPYKEAEGLYNLDLSQLSQGTYLVRVSCSQQQELIQVLKL